MKRSYISMMGVTLLEIMLVLVIAALVIVMSIRFYQSASSSNKQNAMVSLVQGLIAGIENCANANNNDYSQCGTAGILPYMPSGVMPKTPWGGTVTTAGSANYVTITMTPTPAADDCTKLITTLSQNKTIVTAAGCGSIVYTP